MKAFKKVVLLAIMGLFLSLNVMSVSAEEVSGCDLVADAEARIGTVPYETLEAAVEAANAMNPAEGETVEIVLLKDIELDQKVTISKNTTISGAYTIYRAKGYLDQMFSVSAGVKLVMKDLTVDGNNQWELNWTKLENDVKTMDPVYGGGYGAYVTYEEGAPVATASVVMDVAGHVSLDNTAFRNHAGSGLFFVGGNAKLEVTDTAIDHITKSSGHVFCDVAAGGTLIVNEGTTITNCFGAGNGLLGVINGTAIINGGEIYHNGGYDCNGYVFMIIGGDAYCTMNGGYIHDNIGTRGGSNGWNCAFYVYDGCKGFEMNGGTIEDNFSSSLAGVANNGSAGKIFLNGGTVQNTHSTRGFKAKDLSAYCPVWVSNTVNYATSRFYGNLTNTGTLNGNVWFYRYEMQYSGNGTINGNVSVILGAETKLENGVWNGLVTVDAVGEDSTLTVKQGATITGGPVRVLDSVASGNSENGEQAAAAQAASYVEEAGAAVNVPVLYYHRLTSGQKSAVVVTYDYNGGLDAQNWSGIQRTGTSPLTLEPLPEPARDGYVLDGWVVANDQDPESLDMSGTEKYVPGTAATESIRYIAQWRLERAPEYTATYVYAGEVPENAPAVPAAKSYEEGEEVELPQISVDGYTFVWDTSVLNDGKMPAEAVTITGTWTKNPPPTYTATYAYAGEVPENAPAAPAAKAYEEGEEVELPQISVDGYTFVWDTGVLNEGKMPAEAVTITGTWTKNPPPTYTATYAYAGEVPENAPAVPAAKNYEEEEEVELPQISVDGYTFVWDTSVLNEGKMPAEAVTITGTWTKNPPAEGEGGNSGENGEENNGEENGGEENNGEEDESVDSSESDTEDRNDSEQAADPFNGLTLVTLPDEEVPLAAAPKTGDPIGYWFLLGSTSLTALASVLTKKRKK